MNKAIITFLIALVLLFAPATLHAEGIAGQSATITYSVFTDNKCKLPLNYAQKKKAIEKVLAKYNSPLAGEVDTFISACQTYGMDCYLLPAITGLESSFGQFIWPDSHNPFGWGGGYIMFDNWSDGIMTVASGLHENYIQRGANDLYAIGPIYSESPTWAVRVEKFMAEMEHEEKDMQLFLGDNQVQL